MARFIDSDFLCRGDGYVGFGDVYCARRCSSLSSFTRNQTTFYNLDYQNYLLNSQMPYVRFVAPFQRDRICSRLSPLNAVHIFSIGVEIS